MKMSQGVEWMMHSTALIAQTPDGAAMPRRFLAEHYGLPEPYLAKHLKALVRAGVLTATPGPSGGFRLGRPAESITLLDIVEAIEGSSPPFACLEIRQQGTGALPPEACRRPCGMSTLVQRAHQAWQASLRETSVADLVKTTPNSVKRANKAKLAQLSAR
ncbi:RrF2 family transcriptional regulator [Kribbella sp. NPDC051586]|uniref:RrF2 family transcriptional regulator n=1 Tax=Kribbella sp. NPDC051586 TaxID=3364118 RepID=UPI0037A08643